MMRGVVRRLPALARLSGSSGSSSSFCTAGFPFVHDAQECNKGFGLQEDGGVLFRSPSRVTGFLFHRGFASDALEGGSAGTLAVPPTIAALKNPTGKITYDESVHERHPPGDPSKKAFTYLVLTGGRFVYASALRLLALKLILSMSVLHQKVTKSLQGSKYLWVSSGHCYDKVSSAVSKSVSMHVQDFSMVFQNSLLYPFSQTRPRLYHGANTACDPENFSCQKECQDSFS